MLYCRNQEMIITLLLLFSLIRNNARKSTWLFSLLLDVNAQEGGCEICICTYQKLSQEDKKIVNKSQESSH